ncbi:helicase-related protein [[Eubacterium] cellulosolvens]
MSSNYKEKNAHAPIASVEKEFVEYPLIWPNKVEARTYQQTIADKTIQRNTLVVLPTALGKTIISALAAAHFLYNYGHMRILVMAPTRPLVLQHKESFMKVLKLREKDASLLTGKTPSIYRRQIWDSSRIVFATPQVVENDLKNGVLSLRDFSFLVFDECHRARKDYAYTYVAEKYVEQSAWPILLGLTASPGADKKKIEEICKALFIEQVEYRSEEDADVAPYINPVEVEWRYINLPAEYRAISQVIRALLNEKIGWLTRAGVIHKKREYVGRRELLEAGEALHYRLEETIDEERGPIYAAIVKQSAALTLFHALELLETQGISTFTTFLEKVEKESGEKKSYKTIINDQNFARLKVLLKQYSNLDHPKIPLLKSIVEERLRLHPRSKILIFTQYRDTASYLVDQLKIGGVSVERFVGQASKSGDPGLSQTAQAEIIINFREGETDVLVATCIAEEGLDIPSVDLVVFYEPIPSEIRYIQRKGRTGRKTAGKAVILAARETYDEIYLYASKRRIERMKKTIGRINKELNSLVRLGLRPEANPLSKKEIEEIEKEASIIKTKPDLVKAEGEKVKELLRETEKVARHAYMKILKAGERGILIDDLTEEIAEEGFTPATIRPAVERLRAEGLVNKPRRDRVAPSTAHKPISHTTYQKDIYEVEVEKIYPGVAVVWIDDKWRARITPHNFEGPANLMKKNSRFKARGTLYHEDGKLCFKVKNVVELLT